MINRYTAKKGLGPVVATALLLVVAVVAVVGFQTWFQGYSSSLYVQGESQSGDLTTGVERVVGESLYIKSNEDTLEVTKIEVNGEVCSDNFQLSKGVNKVDLTTCLSTTPKGSVASAVVYTNDKIYEHSFISSYDPLPSGFITKWDTRITDENTSASNQIRLPLISSGTYNFNVSWGDGSNDTITSWNQGEIIHTYSEPGIYEVIIEGTIVGFDFNPGLDPFGFGVINTSDAKKLIEIKQWGPLNLIDDKGYFFGANNLEISAKDPLNLTGVTSLSFMFANSNFFSNELTKNDFKVTGNINNWDTSNIVIMNYMFTSTSFNSPINTWDTSNVRTLGGIFANSPFNQPLDNWDTSNVEDMSAIFSSASLFNQDLSSWNTSNVTDMSIMFRDTINFNQDISSWDVSIVEHMDYMFYNATNFNQNLSSWNVSSVFTCGDFNTSTPSWSLPKPNFLCSIEGGGGFS